MTNLFCGDNGDDAKNGQTWDNRTATIAGVLGKARSAGDRLYVGQGAYRELVTLGAGGATVTSAGSIAVTEGGKIVTGTGTNWDPAVHAGDRLFIPWLAYGDTALGTGCAFDGGGTLTSVGADFYPAAIGFAVNVQTRGSYLIAAMAGAGPPHDAVTLTDINAIAWAAGGPFNFWIPSNEGSYEIESVDSDTQITLMRAWSGPTYTWSNARYTSTVEGYEIIRPVYLIGDETGANTDGVGGIVRITGSLDDKTATHNYGIYGSSRNYWVIKGFQVDTVDVDCIRIDDGEHITIEDVRTLSPDSTDSHIYLLGDIDRCTVRRCALFGGKQTWGINLADVGHHYTECNVFENIYAATYKPFRVDDYNNTVIKCCTSGMNCEAFLTVPAGAVLGMGTFIHDCEIHYSSLIALDDNISGVIVANWCNFWDNTLIGGFNIRNGTVGAGCSEYLYLPDSPLLVDDFRYPVRLYPPSEWWEPAQYTGLYPANEDMYGIARPTIKTKRSLGPYQDFHVERNATVVRAGWAASMEQIDARADMLRVAISGEPVTASVYVYLEANYAGVAPKLIVHQAGNTDVEDVATGTTGAWEQLSVSYTPNAQPLEIWVELVSDNTAAAGALVGALWSEVQVLS